MPRPLAPPRALVIDADAAFLADLAAQLGMGLMRLEQATGGAHALRLLRTFRRGRTGCRCASIAGAWPPTG